MDDRKEKMLELRNILDEIEENREKGMKDGNTIDELDFYLEEILAE